jgi:hypothetical protein
MRNRAGKKKKPPPRWRRHLVQAELELPPPSAAAFSAVGDDETEVVLQELEWWQRPSAVGALATFCAVLLLVTGYSLYGAHRDRALAVEAAERVKSLTLRASTAERALRINPNPRSFSANPDATIAFPEPPEMLDIFLPVAYADFPSYWLAIDKVDEGRVLVVQRITPDSNKELRLSLNSSSFGPGEYRFRLQGYTWSGERVDAGWVRLVVQ